MANRKFMLILFEHKSTWHEFLPSTTIRFSPSLSLSLSFSTDTYGQSKENPWFYCWITAALFSSCYAYIWDIKMDWGLFDAKAGENRFLREEIVYSSTVSLSLSLASSMDSFMVSSNGGNKYLSKWTARKTIFQRIHYISSYFLLCFSCSGSITLA